MTARTTADPAGVPAASPGVRTTRGIVLDVLRWTGVVLVTGFACYHLVGNRDEVLATLAGIPLASAVTAQLAVLAAIVVSTYGWQALVDHLGAPVGYFRGAQIYLVGQLGKYAPGSVWGYLLQMELGRKAGLARARVFTASLVHFAVIMVTGLLVGVLVVPALAEAVPAVRWIPLAVLPALLALHPRLLSRVTSTVLRVVRRPGLARPLGAGVLGTAAASGALAFALQGVHLWLLAGTLGSGAWAISGLAGLEGVLLCAGAMALGSIASAAAFFLPAGVGAREGVLVAVLVTGGASAAQALAFAAVSRVMFVVADLVLAGSAAGAARREGVRVR